MQKNLAKLIKLEPLANISVTECKIEGSLTVLNEAGEENTSEHPCNDHPLADAGYQPPTSKPPIDR
jgi:hypothetical protein